MSEPQQEDLSSTALTEIERLLQVWDELNPNSAIMDLIHQRIAKLSLPRLHADVVVTFKNLSRLIEIHNNLRSRRISGTSLIKFMAEKFKQKEEANSLWHVNEMPKSGLQLFEDLDQWTTLNTMLENSVPTHTIRRWISNINCIISTDVDALAALPVSSNVSADSLRVIEIGAKLLKALPDQHRAKVSQVVDSRIKALTASSAYTSGLNYEHGSASHAVPESNDSQINLNPQTENELTPMHSGHVSVTVALSDQIFQLQELAPQLEAVIHGLQQESSDLTAEKNRLEGQVHDLTHDVQSSEIEMLGLRSRTNDLQSKNAGLEKKFMESKSRNEIAIRKLEDEVASLKQALSDYRNDDRIYDDSFKSRAEKLTEELAEAAEDKATLTRDVARVAVDKTIMEEALARSEDSKTAMSSEIHELGTKIDRLEQELKDSSDSLEEAEDDRAMLSRNVEKLTSENADLRNLLGRISSFSTSIQSVYTGAALQSVNADDEMDTAASSTGMLTPASSTQATPE